MTPEAFYASPLQQPLAVGLASLVGAAYALSARAGLASLGPAGPRWAVCFALAIVADAALTAPSSPLTGAAATAASFIFVTLGDFRAYWVLKKAQDDTRPAAPWALGLALAPSLLVALGKVVAPAFFSVARQLYLFYELASLGLLLALGVGLSARGLAHPRLFRGALALALGHYALWALSDVLILSGVSMGYLLRMLPNLLYYGAFVPAAVYLGAPREAR
ncbi:MAG: hypothetical protein JNK72_23250 [Myxococcales bacterium]|nr:hypothetical protein [Myxococcales bacterium]